MNPTKEKEPAAVGAVASSAESSASIKDSANNITYKFANVKSRRPDIVADTIRIIRIQIRIEDCAEKIKALKERIQRLEEDRKEIADLLNSVQGGARQWLKS